MGSPSAKEAAHILVKLCEDSRYNLDNEFFSQLNKLKDTQAELNVAVKNGFIIYDNGERVDLPLAGNMANYSEFSSELTKLKKYILIDIILNKNVSDNVPVSKELKAYINGDEDAEVFTDANDVNNHNLKNSAEFICVQNNAKMLKVELENTKSIIKNLETMVSDKELIINLLRNDLQRKQCDVANTSNKSQNKSNLPNAEKELSYSESTSAVKPPAERIKKTSNEIQNKANNNKKSVWITNKR
ncbi:unnamed protein product [Brassicogethes aeneus]|uniref:Uncharacterized protein n=1 Tax=Brassicogethes aeneus TaxID=1431903 RepID=A0A9P0FLF2_BRAAE|nr:unnamed protein product [Brassicogethes aeneus]